MKTFMYTFRRGHRTSCPSGYFGKHCPSCLGIASYLTKIGAVDPDLCQALCTFAYDTPSKRVKPLATVVRLIAKLQPELLPMIAIQEGRDHDWARDALSGGKPTRLLSGAARCAAEVRQELKRHFPGVKVLSVKSGSSSVHVVLSRMEAVDTEARVDRALSSKFQKGHFDSIDDSYTYSNLQSGVAQVLYVDVRREY